MLDTISKMKETGQFSSTSSRRFQDAILGWYDANKRDLPWRANRNPYRVWVSEIMLQQTRVAVVIGYFERFMEQFPDVHTLARARESAVLAAWSGLGYYRRARGLHATAKVIVNQFEGTFPKSARELQNLPGIGRYTAAAIASIAFDEPCAVVDGNVERVLGRLTNAADMNARKAWTIAQHLISHKRPGDFNQAMMELGATVCTPAKPVCGECPVSTLCKTKAPIETAKPELRIKKEITYALHITKGRVCLVKRPAAGRLMPGMWELPLAAANANQESLFTLRHSITNTDYKVHVVRQKNLPDNDFQWFSFAKAERLPLTGVARKVLRKAGLIE